MEHTLLISATEKPKPPKLDIVHPLAHGLFESVRALWPLWVLVGLAALGKLAHRLYRMRRLARSRITEIDKMDGRTFEVYLSTLFRRLGYSVEVTKYRGDYGADLVIKKKGRKTAVQAKRYTKRVGVKAVQEAVAAKALYGCEHALVVANREFTQQARRLARANKVELWDREVLVSKLLAARGKRRKGPLAEPIATNSSPATKPSLSTPQLAPQPVVEPTTKTVADTIHCARCGTTVSAKVREYCLTRPARFGGLVYCFQHQRSVRQAVTE